MFSRIALAGALAASLIASIEAQAGQSQTDGFTSTGYLSPTYAFQNDHTYVVGGKHSGIGCTSDSATCGAAPTIRGLPGNYDPAASDIVLAGFRITDVTGGDQTSKLKVRIAKRAYDPAAGTFTWEIIVDFGVYPMRYTFEYEYWVVLTQPVAGAMLTMKPLANSCSGVGTCSNTAILNNAVEIGRTFIGFGLQEFDLTAVDAQGWPAAGRVSEMKVDAQSGVYVGSTRQARQNLNCAFTGDASLGSNIACSTRSVVVGVQDNWYSQNHRTQQNTFYSPDWTLPYQLSPTRVDYNYAFYALNYFDFLSLTYPLPGTTQLRAGCFVNGQVSDAFTFEGLISDSNPPTNDFQVEVKCLSALAGHATAL